LAIDGRVKDAIGLAGGTVMDADTSILNLAEILKDGQKLYIPLKDEKVEFPLISEDENLKTLKAVKSGIKFPININTATEMELESLPGVGEVRAKDIIEYRNRNGGFKSKSEIMNVKGIGDGTYEKIKDLIYI
ncbi:helix-hairpin-helix domain-containing protein, partial [bacterium]|nr:helix-hairpin-helix domain-containing protein [bacterium]MBU1025546.1 helix-hairpin-helix domain-containing protein [bacterium]